MLGSCSQYTLYQKVSNIGEEIRHGVKITAIYGLSVFNFQISSTL